MRRVGRRRLAAGGVWTGLLAVLLAACSTTRVVPIPAAGVALDAGAGTASAAADGVQVVVRPSAWHGSPTYLPNYVTPFHLLIVNGAGQPLSYDYRDLRLFDEARFQYTALPPVEVGRLLQASGAERETLVAAADTASLPLHRRRPLFWSPWWWDPWPYPYYAPPRLDDVFTQALPVGTLQAGARTQGFVYFPRLRPEASRLSFEFHHRLGELSRVLTLPFAVERAQHAPPPTAS